MTDFNRKVLVQLKKTISEIKLTKSSFDFERKLNQIGKLDVSLVKDFFTGSEQTEYVALTKQCSKIVESKTREFEHKKNVEYNLRAIEEYEKIFNMFKSGSVPNNHLAILKGFFGFDTSRLFNETLAYYNHVYSFVLSKFDDDGKFVLTKYAVMSERRG